MASSFLSFSLLFIISLYTADGFLNYMTTRCDFNSTDLKNIEYIRSYYYNKLELLRFSSSVGEYVGYTELGVKNAERFNKDPSKLAQMRGEKERYCLTNVNADYQGALDKSVKPYVRLHSVAPPAGKHPSMLVCSVYDFFPKHIRVSWLRDGQEVTSDVTSTDELADADWFYQIHSHLEYTPRSVQNQNQNQVHSHLEYTPRSVQDQNQVQIVPDPLSPGVHAQVWREDLLCGGARQPERTSGY
uniref:Ig-like domain-containing protein n=1 Tax=Dicentrarchus labrax TaxID=13489 RepID=A0A8C4DL39_DICLA